MESPSLRREERESQECGCEEQPEEKVGKGPCESRVEAAESSTKWLERRAEASHSQAIRLSSLHRTLCSPQTFTMNTTIPNATGLATFSLQGTTAPACQLRRAHCNEPRGSLGTLEVTRKCHRPLGLEGVAGAAAHFCWMHTTNLSKNGAMATLSVNRTGRRPLPTTCRRESILMSGHGSGFGNAHTTSRAESKSMTAFYGVGRALQPGAHSVERSVNAEERLRCGGTCAA